MRVIVEMYGPLQRYNKDGQRRAELDIDEDVTVRDLLVKLGMDMDEPWNAGLNGTLADPSDKLSEGSLLVVFPPMAGG
ncbi:MAG TPA: MoaD/ThiS family protein [Dehalococcoidia bacterium]|nr:MoaD/ThiS family protein [Dehalococcoidia bacterium]